MKRACKSNFTRGIDDCSLVSDRAKVERIFQNVFNNAVKFTAEGQINVKVQATPDKTGIEFEIIDTGIGIEESKIDSIFEPFHQADNSMQRAYSGLGLGLTVARRMAELIGGTIDRHQQAGCRYASSMSFPSQVNGATGVDSSSSANMDNGRYIWCRNCGAIHHVTAFDRYPIYALAGGEAQALPANDWRDFMARHAGHRLEAMQPREMTIFLQVPRLIRWTSHMLKLATAQKHCCCAEAARASTKPLNYEIVNGRLVQTEVSLEIQEEAIRKEMKLHFSWSPAGP